MRQRRECHGCVLCDTKGKIGREKSKSSPSRGGGVNAQYALHVWDSQEDSKNPSFPSGLPSGLPFITAGLNRLRFYITPPLSTFFHEAPAIGPGSIE
ncbi:hypothetical protein EV44_g3376 [Erysiphe necator]|uniref:Uncharacterized protein n=1 Tax=Uncinula necator TaxID=52586 RepID=A0A0B1PH48_UNCNE|nr:hypothetical protein EV44_g3376 [Erysiphe necator]